jgi:D-alanyl-D-alanine carboxypeptidase (penicillin-binding protein 5/6)
MNSLRAIQCLLATTALICLAGCAAPRASDSSARGNAQTLRFDFGSGGRKVPAHWNHLTAAGKVGVVLRNAIDSKGRVTSVNVRQLDVCTGVNENGTSDSERLPSQATRDSFVVGVGDLRSARFRLEGLRPGRGYDLAVFGSRMGGTANRKGVYRVGSDSQILDAHDNVSRELRFSDVRADSAGGITLRMTSPNPGFAYLGALEVRGKFDRARPRRNAMPKLDGPPIVSVRAWAIADGDTGEILWEQEGGRRLPMASTTKMMTALLVARLAKRDASVLEEKVLVSKSADETRGSSAGIREGERVPVKDLLYGLLLPSGNDASMAFAEHFNDRFPPADDPPETGPAADPLRTNFIAEMNRTAQRIGLSTTGYAQPHGMDSPGHYSSVRDLIKLAREVLNEPELAKRVRTREYNCEIQQANGATREAVWRNTNRLLTYEGYDGVKTGTTGASGACLVSSGRRGDDHLILAVLGASHSDFRYVDSRNLYRWAWKRLGHAE